MTTLTTVTAVELFTKQLKAAGLGPFYGTPCGVLAPLYAALERDSSLKTVVREDTAVGLAAGAALAGRYPVVLMQNSGLGQSVNALASLTVPYDLPVVLVVSMRGTGPDRTQENLGMGRATIAVLDALGIPSAEYTPGDANVLSELLSRPGIWSRALLIPPDAFGWSA